MESKDQILANFQVCSGVDDVGIAFTHLEANNWNLVEAINSFIPDDPVPPVVAPPNIDASASAVPFPNFPTHLLPGGEMVIDEERRDVAVSVQEIGQTEVLKLNIKVLFHDESDYREDFPLEVPSGTLVGELKSTLYQLLGVLPCNQEILGFKDGTTDSTLIYQSTIEENSTLRLKIKNPASVNRSGTSSSGPDIMEVDANNEVVALSSNSVAHSIPSTSSFSSFNSKDTSSEQSKRGESKTSNYSERKSSLRRNKSKVNSDIEVLESNGPSTSSSSSHRRKVTAKKRSPAPTSDDSSDEFEDALEMNHDDDYLEIMDDVEEKKGNKLTPLLPESIGTDEQECTDHFVREFSSRYGNLVPLFFQGPLKEAIEQSVLMAVGQRRLLAIYLHHDGSVLTNVFCSQVLCQQSTIQYLADNFILWGWDVSSLGHRENLIAKLAGLIGSSAGVTVRSFKTEQYPMLIVVAKNRSACEVISVIHGDSTIDEVITGLMSSVEMFEGTRSDELAVEMERQSRQAIMSDQDAAYQESLRQDRAKAERKKQDEENEQREKEMQESARLHEMVVTEQLRQSLLNDLPPEPEDKEAPDVLIMRFRMPSQNAQEPFTRAFHMDNKLQDVLNFLHVKDFPADQYKFLQTWPRRDISSLNVSMTLRDIKIPARETITIEER